MTRPAQRTVDEVAAPYANFLVRVPRVAHDVCEVCHSFVDPAYARCWPCNEAVKVLGRGTADVVSFVSMAPTGEQMARELFTYKHGDVGENVRRRRQVGLAAVLWKWLASHERCMASETGVDSGFDVITTIPSTSGRDGEHPLEQLVRGIVAGSSERYRTVLAAGEATFGRRDFATERYEAVDDLAGKTVLAVDDTWTTGAHAQSASSALKTAGAAKVGIVAIGRWVNLDYGGTREWLSRHRAPGWDWERCCLTN